MGLLYTMEAIMISDASTLTIHKAISDDIEIVHNLIDGVLAIYDSEPSWYVTCEKLHKVKAMHDTSVKYKFVQKIIQEFPFFVPVEILSKNDNSLVRKIEIVNSKDPLLKSLGLPIAQIILGTLKQNYLSGGIFALIASRAMIALSDLVKNLEKAGMGAVYELQLQVLDGANLHDRLKYLAWFRTQSLAAVSLTALGAFSMCVSSLLEMNENEQIYWKGRFSELSHRYCDKPNVYYHLMSLKNTSSRNCTCAVF